MTRIVVPCGVTGILYDGQGRLGRAGSAGGVGLLSI